MKIQNIDEEIIVYMYYRPTTYRYLIFYISLSQNSDISILHIYDVHLHCLDGNSRNTHLFSNKIVFSSKKEGILNNKQTFFQYHNW